MAAKWIRTCQECFNKQEGKEPPMKAPNEQAYWKWAEAKCKKCRSEALDFGGWVNQNKEEDNDL